MEKIDGEDNKPEDNVWAECITIYGKIRKKWDFSSRKVPLLGYWLPIADSKSVI